MSTYVLYIIFINAMTSFVVTSLSYIVQCIKKAKHLMALAQFIPIICIVSIPRL